MIDELNNLTATTDKAVPYDKYFGEMELSEKQKKERKALAEDIEEVMLFVFSLFALYKEYGAEPNIAYIQSMAKVKILAVVGKLADNIKLSNEIAREVNSYINEYADDLLSDLLETTVNHETDEYYLSNDRAMFVAENESNTVCNYLDFKKAVAKGKKYKTWIDKRDNRERKTHLAVGGRTIGIQQLFLVGDSFMLFPKDTSMGAKPKEIVNCRCTIKYL